MRVLASLEPVGAGTDCAESFHSVLQRTASAHQVSLTKLILFLKAAGNFTTLSFPKGFDLIAATTGTGSFTRSLVKSFESLSRCDGLESHTLLPLSGVLSPRATTALHPVQRWCPLCVDPANENRYGMLAWALRSVTQCPLHRVSLLERCQRCFRHQTYRVALILDPHCRHCGAPLWGKGNGTISDRTSYRSWAEYQLFEMVAFLSTPGREMPSAHWLNDNAELLSELGRDAIGKFRRQDARQASLLRRLPDHGLQLNTLLWLAANHSARLVDVILRPREVLTGVFPNLEPIARAIPKRRAYARSQWTLYRETALKLLEAGERVYLPAQATLAALFRISVPWNYDPSLARLYRNARLSSVRPASGPVAGAHDRLFLVKVIERQESEYANDFNVAQILSRRSIEVSDCLSQRIASAAEIVRGVIGRTIELKPSDIGLSRTGAR